MTDYERAVADALSRCTFLPASADKRFARDMGYRAGLAKPEPLTERQAAHLIRLAWKYRRQMPSELVPTRKPQ